MNSSTLLQRQETLFLMKHSHASSVKGLHSWTALYW